MAVSSNNVSTYPDARLPEVGRIYAENCLETMARMPDGFVDVLVLDPMFDQWPQFLNFPMRILKPHGLVITFSHRPITSRVQSAFESVLPFVTEIIWNFSDGRWVSNNLPRICHENILIFGNRKLNDARLLAWIDKPKPSKKGGSSIGRWRSADERFYQPEDLAQVESVIFLPRRVSEGLGIISKPVELMELLIRLTSNEGDLVYDPFMGSGTTAKAAHQLGRRWIGSEISEEYVALANKRLGNYILDSLT